MKILALERELPEASEDDFRRLGRAEAARAWELHQEGVIRELYFRADRRTAVLVLECEDLVSAQEALASLPLVASGLIEFELIPLAPYSGFERLFRDLSG